MKLLFACHRNPFELKSNGAEISMRTIIHYLMDQGYTVDVISRKGGPYTPDQFDRLIWDQVSEYDHVFTWAQAAYSTCESCIAKQVPYTLMIRWFRLISPVPPGRLMKEKPWDHIEEHQHLFYHSHKIITNTKWAARVIEEYFGTEAECSYVPIETSDEENVRDPKGPPVIVSPDKNLGEWEVIEQFVKAGRRIRVVGAEDRKISSPLIGYMPRQREIKEALRGCSRLLSPVYYNDICGTTRVVIEALRHGLPVTASDASGMREWVPTDGLIRTDDPMSAWLWDQYYCPSPIWQRYKEQQMMSLHKFEP